MGIYDSPRINRKRLRIISGFLFVVFVSWAVNYRIDAAPSLTMFRNQLFGLATLVAAIALWRGSRLASGSFLFWSALMASTAFVPGHPEGVDFYAVLSTAVGLLVLVLLNVAIHRSLPGRDPATV
jgi:hypothetical protein